MKTLETKFKEGGFHFRQLKREGMVALFEKAKPTYGHDSYEIVIIQVHPAQTIKVGAGPSRQYPEREAMPPSESWGRLGWTTMTLEQAERRFKMVVESQSEAVSDTPLPAS